MGDSNWHGLRDDEQSALGWIGLAKNGRRYAHPNHQRWIRLEAKGMVTCYQRSKRFAFYELTDLGRATLRSLTASDARWLFPNAADIEAIQERLK